MKKGKYQFNDDETRAIAEGFGVWQCYKVTWKRQTPNMATDTCEILNVGSAWTYEHAERFLKGEDVWLLS